MAIEFCFAIGYGIVISQEEFEAIKNIIEDTNDRNDWCYKWAQCLDCWGNSDEHFVGITYTVLDSDDGVKSFRKDKYILDLKDKEAFLKFYNKYHLEKFFEWKPDCCAIAFIW